MKENKKYSTPELEIIELDCEDIIQTSGGDGLIDGTETTPDGTGQITGGSSSSIFSTGTPTEIGNFFK